MDSTMIETGTHLLEKISNPILAILLFFLLASIYLLYRGNNDKTKSIEDVRAKKDAEIKELNKVLLEVRESDKEMLTELKNVISRFVEVEKERVDASRSAYETLKRNNELLMQLVVKSDYPLTKIKR
jgi:hypothetical protein